MFEQTFKNIDDVLWKDAGCSSELDYTEQSSWLLFLKYLDDLEGDKQTEAALSGKPCVPILAPEYRWSAWAAPKLANGKIDENKALTGDDLKDFVNAKLFPYLQSFKQKAERAGSIEYKIGEIFSEITNEIQSGYILREALNLMDELRFRSQKEKFELSALYEDKIQRMGNAGRNGGEYYTPRPLIRAIVQVVNPQIGKTVYDGAVGSAGFLCEAYTYLNRKSDLTTAERDILQQRTFFGKEKKSLAYVIAIMNMILHGIEAPNILHTNTLGENLNVILYSNDVLLNITGASLARCCVLPEEYVGGRVNQHVLILRPAQDKLNSYFLCYTLFAGINKQKLLRIGDEAGATRQALTKSDIEIFEVPAPPLPEQHSIVARLDELSAHCKNLESIYAQKIALCDELKQSLLHKAFSGEL